jgi:hypothetical protein
MKYKVGDVVKLSTGDKGIVKDVKLEKVYYPSPIYGKDEVKEEYKYKCEIENDDTYNLYEKEIIGLWEGYKSSEQVSKSEGKSEGKYKLIDILNKIANGELKEGTKVIYDEETYILNDENELERELGFTLLDDIYMNNLSDEVELIEPDHLPNVGKMAEPIDNIEELDADYYEDQPKDYTIRAIINKLNEVIRYINKGAEE